MIKESVRVSTALSRDPTSHSRTLQLDRCLNVFIFLAPPRYLPTPPVYPWAVCACVLVLTHTHTHTFQSALLQRGVDLCSLFNIAWNTTALSHLGKQVIAISIIYSDIQRPRPQTLLTNTLTEINAAAHKQARPAPPPPIRLSRLRSFIFSSVLPIIFFSSVSFSTFSVIFSFNFLSSSNKNTNKSPYVSRNFSLTFKAVLSWIILSNNQNK